MISLNDSIPLYISMIDELDINEEDKEDIKNTLKTFIVFLVEKDSLGIDNDFTKERIKMIEEYLIILKGDYGVEI